MRKSAVIALILILLSGVSVFADIADTLEASLSTDFKLLMEGLGNDIVPVLQQNSLAGQNIGMAEFGDSVFYIGLPVISLTMANGFLTFMNDDDYFEVLPLDDILDSMFLDKLRNSFLGSDAVDFLLNSMTPFPTVKLNGGVKLPLDLELLVQGMWLPAELSSAILGLVPDLPNISLSALNLGAYVRYPLLKDSETSPALSIGAGFYYDNMHFGIALSEIPEITTMLTSAGVTLANGAGLSIDTNMYTFGLEVACSKKLAFFVPFAKLGAWYGIGDFSGEAIITDSNNPVSSVTAINDLSFIATGGFDLLLGPYVMNLNGNYNLGSGVWAISMGSRFQL